jgi:hypothetical protein
MAFTRLHMTTKFAHFVQQREGRAGDATLLRAGDATLLRAGDATLLRAGDATLLRAGDATLLRAGDASLLRAGDADLPRWVRKLVGVVRMEGEVESPFCVHGRRNCRAVDGATVTHVGLLVTILSYSRKFFLHLFDGSVYHP